MTGSTRTRTASGNPANCVVQQPRLTLLPVGMKSIRNNRHGCVYECQAHAVQGEFMLKASWVKTEAKDNLTQLELHIGFRRAFQTVSCRNTQPLP